MMRGEGEDVVCNPEDQVIGKEKGSRENVAR